MEILLLVETKNYQKVKEILLKDDVISRASVSFKAKSVGSEGYYCYISGLEEQCKKAIELTKDLAKEIESREKEEFIKKFKEEEDRANVGFGSIFG